MLLQSDRRIAHASERWNASRSNAEQLLVMRLGDQTFGLPLAAVERIIGMAAPTPLPDAPSGVVGLLNFQGSLLPIVDLRPRLGLSTPPFRPDQHLIVVSAGSRFLLWADRVERIVTAEPDRVESVSGELTSAAVRLDDDVMLVLSVESLDPGPVLGLSWESGQ